VDHFEYKSGALFCEGVDLSPLLADVGSPAYVYSSATLRDHYTAMAEAFAPLEARICFSVKSLANLSVLRLLAGLGAGFDVVSGGEIFRVRRAGADMSKVVYAGVAKTDREIREAIAAGVGAFNVESEQEFENLSRLARAAGAAVRAALRVNPDVDPHTHVHTTTGKKATKFGVDLERAERFFADYGSDEFARLTGIHLHIGSPVNSAAPYVQAIAKSLALIERLGRSGHVVDTLNIGGGYGADYQERESPTAADYAAEIVPLLKDTGLNVILEPGRQISCNAGVLLTEVQYVKAGGDKQFVIVDAAMTDLIRPVLYDGWHFIYPIRLGAGRQPPVRTKDFVPPEAVKADVVGGVCESSDFLAKGRLLPSVRRGDVLAVFSAGGAGRRRRLQPRSPARDLRRPDRRGTVTPGGHGRWDEGS